MPSSSDYLKLMEMYRKLDNCHDYRLLDKYIEIIRDASRDYPHPEFDRLLKYAQKRRMYEFNLKFIAVIDVD